MDGRTPNRYITLTDADAASLISLISYCYATIRNIAVYDAVRDKLSNKS